MRRQKDLRIFVKGGSTPLSLENGWPRGNHGIKRFVQALAGTGPDRACRNYRKRYQTVLGHRRQ
jgi:hypothetical protein